MVAVKGVSMEKWLCLGSIIAAGFVFVLFLLDLVLKVPFGRISAFGDVLVIMSCALVAYLGWDAMRDYK